MSWLKRIMFALSILTLVLGAIGFLLPARSHFERNIEVQLRPAVVFAYLSDFHNNSAWSPWVQRDPDIKITYSGAEKGVGAKMSWESQHPKVGNGSQEILSLVDNQSIQIKLELDQQSNASASFKFEATDAGTKIIWGFDYDHGMNPISRYFGLMFDQLIGPDYEQGLTNIKQQLEAH